MCVYIQIDVCIYIYIYLYLYTHIHDLFVVYHMGKRGANICI